VKSIYILILVFIAYSFDVKANITIGTFGPPIDRVREKASETESTFALKPFIGLFYKYPAFFPWVYDFEIGYVFPQTSFENMNPETKNRKLFWELNSNYYWNKMFFGIIGISTVMTKVYGDGSSVKEGSNTYYYPSDEGQTSYNTILNLGLGYDYNQLIYGEFKTHVWQVLDSQSRAFSISLSLKYRVF